MRLTTDIKNARGVLLGKRGDEVEVIATPDVNVVIVRHVKSGERFSVKTTALNQVTETKLF